MVLSQGNILNCRRFIHRLLRVFLHLIHPSVIALLFPKPFQYKHFRWVLYSTLMFKGIFWTSLTFLKEIISNSIYKRKIHPQPFCIFQNIHYNLLLRVSHNELKKYFGFISLCQCFKEKKYINDNYYSAYLLAVQ